MNWPETVALLGLYLFLAIIMIIGALGSLSEKEKPKKPTDTPMWYEYKSYPEEEKEKD